MNAFVRSHLINWRIEKKKQRHTVPSMFAKIIVKLLVGNSEITEVNELKNIFIKVFGFTFEMFRMQIFHIYNL